MDIFQDNYRDNFLDNFNSASFRFKVIACSSEDLKFRTNHTLISKHPELSEKNGRRWPTRSPIPPPLFDNEDEDKGTRTPFMDDIHCRDQSNHPRSTLKHRQEQRAI